MIRIIPRLDIKGSNLVKGVNLEGLRVMGKPEDFARFYYDQGADELIYVDAVASLYGRNSLLHIVEKTAKEIFIPLTAGGGLRNLKDIQNILRAGADKIFLNTEAIQRPEIIREAANAFGSSTVVISIEATKKTDGMYECYTDNGRIPTGIDAIEWAKRVAGLGAGEILLTSIDREGTGKGFDVELVRKVTDVVSIPVIASGGAGKSEHVMDVLKNGKADAVALASILHYRAIQELKVDPRAFTEGNINFLQSGEGFKKVEKVTLVELKNYLAEQGFTVRNCSPEVVG